MGSGVCFDAYKNKLNEGVGGCGGLWSALVM